MTTRHHQSKLDWNVSCFDPGDLLAAFDSSIETIDSKPNKNENYLRKNISLDEFDRLPLACDSRDDPEIWSSEGDSTAKPPDLSAELRDIACQLAYVKPAKQEELRITLGDTVDDSSTKSGRRSLRRISRNSLTSSKLPDIPESSNKSKENKQVTSPNSPLASPEYKLSKDSGATTPTRTTIPINPSTSIRKSIVSKLSLARRRSISSLESTPSSSSASPKDSRSTIASKLSLGRRKSISSSKSQLSTPNISPKGPQSTIASKLSPHHRKSISSPDIDIPILAKTSPNKSKENKQVTPPNSSLASPEYKLLKDSGATTPTRTTIPIEPSTSIRKSIVSKLSPARRRSISSLESTPSSSSASPKDSRSKIASELLLGRRKSISSSKSQLSTLNSSPKGPRSTIASKLSPHHRKSISAPDIDIPILAKTSPTSFLKDAVTMAFRSSELDPSPHQVEIPSSQELLEHSLLCALLESYGDLGGEQNFDFNTLKGIPCQALKAFVSLDSKCIPGLTPDQKPIIQALVDCGKDIEVEGLFSHGDDEPSQVGVFSTQSSNRFIVVYRGTTEQQLKPTRSKHSPVNLDPENPVSVYPPFREAYFPLEKQVYGLLDTLVEKNPFYDVVFTGHSFGGALATIGAARFANARPMLRFFCHTFGSPKVGAHNFRLMVNTLPNLKVMRVEYGFDPNTKVPADMGSFKWEHVGHTLAIHVGGGKLPLRPVTAYRFDNKKPSSVSLLNIRKQENDIQAYVRVIEPFAMGKLPWVSLYAGEDVGEGVLGMNNEKRFLA